MFKRLHRLLQDGCNLGSDEYPITVASGYNLLDPHSGKIVSITRGCGNGYRVSQGGRVHHRSCIANFLLDKLIFIVKWSIGFNESLNNFTG